MFADWKINEPFLKRPGTVTAERIESVMGHVARTHKEAGKGHGSNEARQVALWLARERCGSRMTLREIGKERGGVSGGAVSMACRRIASRAKSDTHLKRTLARLS